MLRLWWRRRIIPARAGFTPSRRRRRRRRWDHPRSRGVYPSTMALAVGMRGSSPLARGLPEADRPRRREDGIIPARAGFTRLRDRSRASGRDHPRSRGVYSEVPEVAVGGVGSSPLARGLRPRPARRARRLRIIPARAGFTPRARIWATWPGDHPRSRGVYVPGVRRIKPAPGSSPLARGLLEANKTEYDAHRIIPARAGFTMT